MELFHRMAESAQKFDYRNDKQPLVSLYIISYNNVHLLYHAIKSVLAQTHGNIEITISDDASVGCTIEDSARLVCLAALDLIFEQNEIPEDTVFCYPWRQTEANCGNDHPRHYTYELYNKCIFYIYLCSTV